MDFDPTRQVFNFNSNDYIAVDKKTLCTRQAMSYTGLRWLDKLIHYFAHPNERLEAINSFFQKALENPPTETDKRWFLLHNIQRFNCQIEKHNHSIFARVFHDQIKPLNADDLARNALLDLKIQLDDLAKDYLYNPNPSQADHNRVREPVAMTYLMILDRK